MGGDTGATRELAETTLLKLAGLGPALLHSDQGTVYTAPRYRDLAKSLNIDLSYSPREIVLTTPVWRIFMGI